MFEDAACGRGAEGPRPLSLGNEGPARAPEPGPRFVDATSQRQLVEAARRARFAVADVEVSGPSLRTALIHAVEMALAERGALPPCVGPDASAPQVVEDQALRLQLSSARGLCIRIDSLLEYAREGILDVEGGECLRVWIERAARVPTPPVLIALPRSERAIALRVPEPLERVLERIAQATEASPEPSAPASILPAVLPPAAPEPVSVERLFSAIDDVDDDPEPLSSPGISQTLAASRHAPYSDPGADEASRPGLPDPSDRGVIAARPLVEPEPPPILDLDVPSTPELELVVPPSDAPEAPVPSVTGHDDPLAAAFARLFSDDRDSGYGIDPIDAHAVESVPLEPADLDGDPTEAASSVHVLELLEERSLERQRDDDERILGAAKHRAHAVELEAAKGPKPVAALERLVCEHYVPLLGALADRATDQGVRNVAEGFRRDFEHSYQSSMTAIRVSGRRPTMVLDVPELATKAARTAGARSVKLLLIDAMSYDLGRRVVARVKRALADRAALVEERMLWSALPSVTPVQMGLLARGASGLRELDAPPSEPDITRGRSLSTIRRMRVGSRELFKLDLCEARLRGAGPRYEDRLEAMASEVAPLVTRFTESLPPRTLVYLFGDHGFVLPPGRGGATGAATQGGATPEEALVGGWALLVDGVH